MDKRLAELGSDKFGPENNPFYNGLEFNDLKEYIKAKSMDKDRIANISQEKVELIDKMNLEELKLFFESEHRRQEDLEKYVLRTREKELVDELNKMKVEKDQISREREDMEKNLGALLAEFNSKKDREMKAK